MRDNALGPGQRFVAAAKVCSRILARDNDVTIQWVPAHSEATSNEVGEYARSAATGDATVIERIPEGYIKETSLPHMTRVATEAGFCEAAEWISGHAMVQAPLGTRLPPAPTQTGEEGPSQPLLPAPVWVRGDRDPPPMVQATCESQVFMKYVNSPN